jgi:GNAT superfamily N-acetyltransferase
MRISVAVEEMEPLYPNAVYGPELRGAQLEGLMRLAKEFVREGRRDMVWGPKTEAMYREIFGRLLADPDAGALVHLCAAGFACAIESPCDTPHGRAAVGFGIYVRPEARGQGLAKAMHAKLLELLQDRGYDAFVTGAETPGGAAVIGELEPVSSYGVIRLGGKT